MKERLAKLLSVKSIITILLTLVFCYLSIKNDINQDFQTIYLMIVTFYFGTQAKKD